jgi:hypothetical protein
VAQKSSSRTHAPSALCHFESARVQLESDVPGGFGETALDLNPPESLMTVLLPLTSSGGAMQF